MSNQPKQARRRWAGGERTSRSKQTAQHNQTQKQKSPYAWDGLETLESRVLFSANLLDPLPIADPAPALEGPQAAIVADETTTGSPSSALALSDTFLLHSNPGAEHTIYLDFNGHITENTRWNSWKGISKIVTPAYDIDGNASSFSDAELTSIGYIFQRVAEDFSPFDVDVTTEQPLLDDLIKSGSSDTRWGGRVVIGGSSYDWTGGFWGGVAYVGSFNSNSDTPAFVFEAQTGNGNEKYTAESVSHEAAHMLGLGHDGNSSTVYYAGHGSGETGWAPIMGNSYYKNLTQWSHGEYADASNSQDDLAIITSQNGFGYRADDHGDNFASASTLDVLGTSISGSGLIERNTDFDVFAFNTDSGLIHLDISPFQRGPNLDVLAELYDVTGGLITSSSSNPTNPLAANILATVSAGNYFLKVSGVGQGDPATTGYSDYASLGQYTISGQVVEPSPFLLVDDVTVDENGTAMFTVSLSQEVDQTVTVDVATADGTATKDSDYLAINQMLMFVSGQTSQTVAVSILDDAVTESSETFGLRLTNATGGVTIFDNVGTGTIVDNDTGTIVDNDTVVLVSINDVVTVNEGNPRKRKNSSPKITQTTFTVRLSEAANDTVKVRYDTADDSATAGSGDYMAESGTVTFAPGETSKTITIGVVGDSEIESDETFSVNLSNAVNATLLADNSTGVGIILNDDSGSTQKGRGSKSGAPGFILAEATDPTLDATSPPAQSRTAALSAAWARQMAQNFTAASSAQSATQRASLQSLLDADHSQANRPWEPLSQGFSLEAIQG